MNNEKSLCNVFVKPQIVDVKIVKNKKEKLQPTILKLQEILLNHVLEDRTVNV